jgi:mannitol/fructose-specific phosphotransferase system IIA component (Ntr-type)
MTGHLDPNAVVFVDDIADKEAALERLAAITCEVYGIADSQRVFDLIFERENKLSTGIGLGIAVPHCRIGGLKGSVIGVMRMTRAIDYNAVDGSPVELMVMIIAPEDDVSGYLSLLAAIARAVSDEDVRNDLLDAETPNDLCGRIGAALFTKAD